MQIPFTVAPILFDLKNLERESDVTKMVTWFLPDLAPHTRKTNNCSWTMHHLEYPRMWE